MHNLYMLSSGWHHVITLQYFQKEKEKKNKLKKCIDEIRGLCQKKKKYKLKKHKESLKWY